MFNGCFSMIGWMPSYTSVTIDWYCLLSEEFWLHVYFVTIKWYIITIYLCNAGVLKVIVKNHWKHTIFIKNFTISACYIRGWSLNGHFLPWIVDLTLVSSTLDGGALLYIVQIVFNWRIGAWSINIIIDYISSTVTYNSHICVIGLVLYISTTFRFL